MHARFPRSSDRHINKCALKYGLNSYGVVTGWQGDERCQMIKPMTNVIGLAWFMRSKPSVMRGLTIGVVFHCLRLFPVSMGRFCRSRVDTHHPVPFLWVREYPRVELQGAGQPNNVTGLRIVRPIVTDHPADFNSFLMQEPLFVRQLSPTRCGVFVLRAGMVNEPPESHHCYYCLHAAASLTRITASSSAEMNSPGTGVNDRSRTPRRGFTQRHHLNALVM